VAVSAALLDACSGLRVLVVGEAILDGYLAGTSERLCPEAPVPVVAVAERSDAPGGAANAAVNVARLGGTALLLSVVGHGVDTASVLVQPGRRTLSKQRVIASSQLVVRFDQGDTTPLDEVTERRLADRLAALFARADAVIVSDYGYGVLTPRVVAALAAAQAATPRVLVADSKRLGVYREVGVTAVKPNYREALALLAGEAGPAAAGRAERILAAGERLLDLTGSQLAAVTLDTDGALFLERGRPPYRTYARPQRHARAAGAGDTFVAALALALAAGGDTPAAAELASAAAAVVTGKDGTAACSRAELAQFLTGADKIVADLGALAARTEFYRAQGRRVVFTNGCFDILHRGHITYLSRAKALGDVLVVGLNSDDGVRRLKGGGRPINPFEDRAQVLAALSCVDHIIGFADDTPAAVIEALRPHVFAKGGDYRRETLPEAPVVERLGGAIHILPFVEDRSTSRIIERIRADRGTDPALGAPDGAPGPERWHGRRSGLGSRTKGAVR
jgi:D-beta-D-heptose 7-phosphate kinase/D-beta-D-heptose 1-phosphate adenosyltransferase